MTQSAQDTFMVWDFFENDSMGKKFGALDQKSATEKTFDRMNAGRAAGLVA